MNKWQIICPIVAMAVVLFIAVPIAGHYAMANQRRHAIRVASGGIGRELITSTNSPRLVHIGTDLRARLSGLLSTTTRVCTVLPGDDPRPIGDGRADSRLVLTNDAGEGLLIRLRQERGTTVFHVLGFRRVSP
ncbi:MAG: hypothetical protein QOF48_3857 [Verrucomicrobiota bacterium]|jgi:hypothetical protein